MLTAKATTKNRIEGLRGGADAYLTKPLDDELLFGAFLEPIPELKQFPDQFFSFRLSVKGIRAYLQNRERKSGL